MAINPNTRDLLTAELNRHDRAASLTPEQRTRVLDQVAPLVKVAGGNHADQLDRAIDHVRFGISLPPTP